MKLSNYRTLISHLPVKEQSFTTKRSTWFKAENDYFWLKELNKTFFDEYGQLTLNRLDVFNSKTIEESIIKTIYWGYPRGIRGNHFRNILNSFDVLVRHCSILKDSETITSAEYFELINDFKKIEGLGLSTYTKILYFLNIKIDHNPCLILDQRIITMIQQNQYPSFNNLSINTYNKEKKYPEYLALMNHLSQELKTKPENLEQFLFLFNNLKSLKSPSIIS
jgi:hypothetical protein